MNAPTPDRWLRLWGELSPTTSPIPVYEDLVARYSQPGRHYHNLRHIAECLAEFDPVRSAALQPTAVELAIWFHDAVYDTHATDNEERSAELATARIAECGGDPDLRRSVAALVLATKAHDRSGHPDASLFVDVDLSILGQAEARFQEYEADIRREYEWVPESIFAKKRSEILKRFLARERIYGTEPFAARYEKQARANLHRSVRKLSGGLTFRAATAADCGLSAELNHQ